jgi:hypothetical protein
MTALDGDRPGAPPRPTNPPDGPPRRFSDLSAADQIRVVEIIRPGFEKALANYRARKAAEAEQLARAA